MVRENFGNVFVDVCAEGCRGIWFDGGELSRLDSERKGGGPSLRRALAPADGVAEFSPLVLPAGTSDVSVGERPWSCPQCDVELDVLEYDLQVTVAIDSCPECTGVFLEDGELAAIRKRKPTEDELQQSRTRWRRRNQRHRRRREQEQRMRGLAAVAYTTHF